MIKLEIVSDLKKGCTSKCVADKSNVEEIAMMIALLEKQKANLQGKFNQMAGASYDSGIKNNE